MFFATLVYECDPATSSDARKLLRAELVGRRWLDRWEGRLLPSNCLWIRRSAEPGETVDHLKVKCTDELKLAAEAVARTGMKIKVTRAWVQVTGAGTFGLADLEGDKP
ncbi:MAG: hypothetical protein U0271_13720 [Polyangiaceae bacterium]